MNTTEGKTLLMTSDSAEQFSLFDDIYEHLMKDDKPSVYLNRISARPEFKEFPFQLLLKLKTTEQSLKYHPEGSVWNHTMMVVDEAAAIRDKFNDIPAAMWTALLHDIGKPDTTRNRKGKITSYDHDIVGAKLSRDFLECFTEEELIRNVSSLVRYHMHMLFILKGLPYGNPEGMIREVDFNDIALLCRCDRLGRAGVDRQEVEEDYDKFVTWLERKKI